VLQITLLHKNEKCVQVGHLLVQSEGMMVQPVDMSQHVHESPQVDLGVHIVDTPEHNC